MDMTYSSETWRAARAEVDLTPLSDWRRFAPNVAGRNRPLEWDGSDR